MAFVRSDLCRIGGSGNGGSTWQYTTTEATSAVVADTNYFANATAELSAGDICWLSVLLEALLLDVFPMLNQITVLPLFVPLVQ